MNIKYKQIVRCSLLFCVGLLVACDSGNSYQAGPIEGPSVQGAAVKGPLANATVKAYLLDYSKADLRGDLLDEGTTNESAEITGLQIPDNRLEDGPFLIHISEGQELNGSAPVIAELQTIVTLEQLREGRIYATPLTTLVIEHARVNMDGDTSSVFLTRLSSAQAIVKESFGLGVLDDSIDLFTTSPLLMGEGQGATLNYRIASEAFSALALDIQQQSSSGIEVLDIVNALAQDLSDGVLDGDRSGVSLAALSGVSDLQSILTQDLSLLMVPGTSTAIGDIKSVLLEEAGQISSGLVVGDLVVPALSQVVVDPENLAPTAVIGDDRNGIVGNIMTLSAEASIDGDGDAITAYRWRMVSRPESSAAELNSTSELTTRFVIDVEGIYIVELIVSDGKSDSEPVTVTVGAGTGSAPDADALASDGDDEFNVEALNVGLLSNINLSGANSSDHDGDELSYQWQIQSMPEGSTASIVSGASSRDARLNAGDLQGEIVVRLTVSDGALVDSDEVVVTVDKSLPTSSAMFGLGMMILYAFTVVRGRRNK